MNWYLKVLKQYADFNGRARRKEYWMFTLFNLIFMIVTIMLDRSLGMTIAPAPYGYLSIIYILAMIIPGIALAVRRLHDVGKSGWFYFIVLIPIIGSIWMLVLFCTEGNRGDNEYGADPKGSIVPDMA
jgi:uncharacterized membrane protein YhaH (DUF805 family)